MPFDLESYDVILGWNWLNKNKAIIECYAAIFKLNSPSGGSIQ